MVKPSSTLPSISECRTIWSRCQQQTQHQIASAIGARNLDPDSPLTELPAFLSTPVPITQVFTNESDVDLISQYLSYKHMGNFALCQILENSHFCTVSVSRQTGPIFGVCLPSTCSATDYVALSSSCTFTRLNATTLELSEADMAVQNLLQIIRSNSTQGLATKSM
jgi:hypothetical protein